MLQQPFNSDRSEPIIEQLYPQHSGDTMALQAGIVGLPNVGKSTLFNALTNAGAESANYPFCTIEPNTGIVPVPDPRLKVINDILLRRP